MRLSVLSLFVTLDVAQAAFGKIECRFSTNMTEQLSPLSIYIKVYIKITSKIMYHVNAVKGVMSAKQ